jgi:hypothetical protein
MFFDPYFGPLVKKAVNREFAHFSARPVQELIHNKKCNKTGKMLPQVP